VTAPGPVIVTGGASGIGTATARALADAGRHVVVLDRNGDGAAAVAAEVDGTAVTADVADHVAIDGAVAAIVEAHGTIAGLVNNAGVGNLKPLEAYSPAEVDLIWRVNVAGTFNCLRAAAPHLRANPGSAVVNLASVSGVRPTRGEAPYSAAKAATIALTKSAALEWAPDVRVNCVSPGFVRTPLNEMLVSDDADREALESRTPLGRVGEADEAAGLIAFLLSDAAAYMTGQNLVLDGGTLLPSSQMDPTLGALLDLFG